MVKMSLLDRIGESIKNFLDGEKEGFARVNRSSHDHDYQEALDELEDFLASGKSKASPTSQPKPAPEKPIPPEVIRAFKELGLKPDASEGKYRETYKNLLKRHHPDRHANHAGNLKKATEKTARLNEANAVLAKWFKRK